MAENQTDLNKNRKKNLARFAEQLPEVAKHITAHKDAVFEHGMFDTKTKRLIAMAIALGAGCRNCVLAQTEAAVNLGATREEILEVLAVVTSMRGTTGVAESLRVIQFMDEMGL